MLIKSIDQMDPILPSLTTEKVLDNIWMASYYVSDPSKCPSWNGFNQTVVSQEQYKISRIEILPFVNHDPDQHNTIFSALMYVQKLTEKHKIGICPVTFDHLFILKQQKLFSHPKISVKQLSGLGGFTYIILVMSYM